MKLPALRKILVSLAIAAVFTAVAMGGLLYSTDNLMSDALYQSPKALSGDIVVIGIDERALASIGPFQTWGRDVFAKAVEYLNEDPNNRPIAIGLDVLFTGQTTPEADTRLVEACSLHNNVVVACFGTFGSAIVSRNGGESYYMDDFALLDYDEPYAALKKVAQYGHINAMYDADGKLRHAMQYIELPDGTLVPSFNNVLYKMWAQHAGLDPHILPPTNFRHFWYVPYTGAPRAYYDSVSMADLVDGTLPRDYFANKIVLIGPYAGGLPDYVLTPIDPATQMFGVEFQANAIDAFISGQFKQKVSDVLQGAVLFVLCAAALLFFWDRKMLPATVVWLVITVGWVGLCKLAYNTGFILHVFWVPLFITVLYVGSVAVNYIRAAVEKMRVTNTFKRYVAPEIVNEILREGSESLGLGGKMTDIAVMFVDIRGFTTMSEVLAPTQVVEILNRYLNLTSSCIMRHGGTLDKFIGDATMAIWGAPLPQEDYIYKAVLTALDMVEGSKALSDELLRQFDRTVSFGIGIHCGPAVVGNIGAQMRMDFTAIGDTVNTAARLESNAPGGKIYISRAVADALEGRLCVTSLGSAIKLKGKAEGFEILVLEGLANDGAPSE